MPRGGFSIFLLCTPCLSLWHAYNKTHIGQPRNVSCPNFHDCSRPLTEQDVHKMRLWPGLMKALDRELGESIYGLKQGLELIWNNQHPPNCSEAKFLVSGGWPYGFGSRIHVEGWGLAIAMELGRVYLQHPDGDNIFWETDNAHCKGQNKNTLDCYYHPWSSCSIKDAVDAQHNDVNTFKITHPSDFNEIFNDPVTRERFQSRIANFKALNLVFTTGGGIYQARRFVPSSVRPIINCSPMQHNLGFYWWRAVSATFLLRPNNATLDALAKYRNGLGGRSRWQSAAPG